MRTILEACAIARKRGYDLPNPVSGPDYETAILTLHHAKIAHNTESEAYTRRILAGQGDYPEAYVKSNRYTRVPEMRPTTGYEQ